MNKRVFKVVFLTVVLATSFVLIHFTGVRAEINSNMEILQQNVPALPAGQVFFRDVRTASDRILVAFFVSSVVDNDAVRINNPAAWKINGKPADAIHRYVFQTDGSHHHIYLETDKLVKGKEYVVETPYGSRRFVFDEKDIFCESIKTNQVGYSALAKSRYANFALWLGTGGGRKIDGILPDYSVIDANGRTVTTGKMKELGDDSSAGGFVYQINLSSVPEGGPYKIIVDGYGSSYPFGVGGEFSKMLAHTIFRAQYLQRCGCPILEPAIRLHPCHTLVYDVGGPRGEANIDVDALIKEKGLVADDIIFKCYGGYHDAGDADRRALHIANPILNLMIYETFPDYFTDGQFRIPGDFDENYNILNYENGIPDILDEALWGTLIWEYLQKEDGSVIYGTETLGYPAPFAAPYDLDTKKWGTVLVDRNGQVINMATCTSAGLFMHMARIIKPFNAKKSAELVARAERAFKAAGKGIADPEKLYYHIQRYLMTGNRADHNEVKKLYKVASGMKDNLYRQPGASLNDERFDNPAYIMSYILEKNVPTDATIVNFFKSAIKDAADANIAELRSHAFPVGNDPVNGGWGHNVRQPQYAAASILYWQISKEQAYFDAASELMDYKLGLNPIGISYVTTLGFHQVLNIHDRESAYTKNLGWGSKPGITAFGPGVYRVSVTDRDRQAYEGAVPGFADLPKERMYIDNRDIISMNEFTIQETMHYDALYTILAGGGKWNGKNPFETNK